MLLSRDRRYGFLSAPVNSQKNCRWQIIRCTCCWLFTGGTFLLLDWRLVAFWLADVILLMKSYIYVNRYSREYVLLTTRSLGSFLPRVTEIHSRLYALSRVSDEESNNWTQHLIVVFGWKKTRNGARANVEDSDNSYGIHYWNLR